MARKTGCIGNFFLKFVLFFWLGVLNSRVFYVPKHCFCICHNLCPEPLITFFSAIPCSQYDLAQNSPSSTMEGRREQSGRTGLQLPLGTRSQLLFKRDGCTHFGVFYQLPGMHGVLEVETERKLEYVALLYYLQPQKDSSKIGGSQICLKEPHQGRLGGSVG